MDADPHHPFESFHSEKGLKEFVELLDENREKLIDNIIYIETEKNDVPVEIALAIQYFIY